MSTTVIARGKLRLAAQRGDPIEAGIGLDREGRPTVDGMEAFNGVTLPFGGMKGAGISMMMELFSGVFTGAAFGGDVTSLYNDFTAKQNVGHFVLVMRADLFMPLSVFKDRMDEFVRRVKAQPMADGCTEIMMPGEVETREHAKRLLHGVPIQDSVLVELTKEAELLGISTVPW
jgi:L-2-hydroxycarboxylate dehydrogenase (NAD+)